MTIYHFSTHSVPLLDTCVKNSHVLKRHSMCFFMVWTKKAVPLFLDVLLHMSLLNKCVERYVGVIQSPFCVFNRSNELL